MTDDFRRYLRAKRTVDDRALDRRLVDGLRDRLADRDDRPLRVLEVGAGIGTMVERLVEWEVLPTGTTEYTTLDADADTVAAVPERLRAWAADRPVSVTPGDPLVVEGPERRVEVDRVAAEAVDYVTDADCTWDLLVGSALLDLLPAAELPALLTALDTGGIWYFPITFDGATRFQPAHPADREVERYYHEHMDAKPGGDSRAGGTTLARLRALDGVSVTDVAGSDWIVRPVDGDYPGEEAAFLRHILGTVEAAVSEVAPGEFDAALTEWVATRRAQLDARELVYSTHQLDLLGRLEDPAALDAK